MNSAHAMFCRIVTVFVLLVLSFCSASVQADASKTAQSQLVVQGVGLTKTNTCFQTAYPDTALTYIDADICADDLAQRLLTQDDSVDVYKIQVDSTFTAVKGKCFFAPLSDSALLRQKTLEMAPEFLEIITDESGTLVAYPATLRISTFGINTDYWNMVFDDRPVPKTVEQLLDAWILFEEEYAEEYPLLDMWHGFDEMFLCRRLIMYYLQTHPNPANTLATDPSLRAVLQKLERIGELRETHQRPLTEWTPEESEGRATIFSLFAERDAMYKTRSFYLDTQENMVYGYSIFNYTSLLLGWSENQYQTIGSMTVFVVNPYSKNVHEAICYIERASEVDVNPYLYYAIYPEMEEPYEDPSFQSRIEKQYEDMGYIEELLERDDLSSTDRHDLEAMLEYQKRTIQDQDQLRWLIASETIEEDRALLGQINLNQANVYSTAMASSQNVQQLCGRYASGELPLDIFLRSLANELYMIDMEQR